MAAALPTHSKTTPTAAATTASTGTGAAAAAARLGFITGHRQGDGGDEHRCQNQHFATHSRFSFCVIKKRATKKLKRFTRRNFLKSSTRFSSQLPPCASHWQCGSHGQHQMHHRRLREEPPRVELYRLGKSICLRRPSQLCRLGKLPYQTGSGCQTKKEKKRLANRQPVSLAGAQYGVGVVAAAAFVKSPGLLFFHRFRVFSTERCRRMAAAAGVRSQQPNQPNRFRPLD